MVDAVDSAEVVMGMRAEKKRESLATALRAELDAIPDAQIDSLRDVGAVAKRMAAALPSKGLGEIVGPVYATSALQRWWGHSRENVSKKARRGKLLALKVDGENLFPAFQFTDDFQVREDVMEVVTVFQGVVSPFTIAQWLATPVVDDVHGRTPVELLDSGAREDVMDRARLLSETWA